MIEDFRLKVFMTVAAEKSFTKAAAELGISQPAVSQNISELEKVMGAKLFDRLRGEVALTPQGKIFQKYVSRILSSYEDLNMIFCNSRINNRTTPIRLFISPLLTGLLSASLFASLEALRPGLSVQLVDSQDAAHVSIVGAIAGTGGSGCSDPGSSGDSGSLSIKIDIISDDILLKGFFRQLVNYCLC